MRQRARAGRAANPRRMGTPPTVASGMSSRRCAHGRRGRPSRMLSRVGGTGTIPGTRCVGMWLTWRSSSRQSAPCAGHYPTPRPSSEWWPSCSSTWAPVEPRTMTTCSGASWSRGFPLRPPDACTRRTGATGWTISPPGWPASDTAGTCGRWSLAGSRKPRRGDGYSAILASTRHLRAVPGGRLARAEGATPRGVLFGAPCPNPCPNGTVRTRPVASGPVLRDPCKRAILGHGVQEVERSNRSAPTTRLLPHTWGQRRTRRDTLNSRGDGCRSRPDPSGDELIPLMIRGSTGTP